jgi:L-idonate 5-dehydrogenase
MLAVRLHAAHDLRVEDVAEQPLGAGEARVRIRAGGICGSDLSYVRKGGVGDFKVREPLTLGHEIAGEIAELDPSVRSLAVGARVAIDPSRPCLACPQCRAGRSNLCENMRFLGSAALMPHVQGGFAETLVVRADQCIPIPDAMSMRLAACAEPLAVALHAVRRAPSMLGRHVLIAGAGPIGLLTLAAARLAGAAAITVADLAGRPLEIASSMGATQTIRIDGDDPLAPVRDRIDIAFEATGAPSSLAALPGLMRRGGAIIQLGMLPPGDTPVPINLLMTREIDLIGSFRFHEEFRLAVELLASGRLDIAPILSASLPVADAGEAFALAMDRSRSIKVHLDFG